MTDKEIILKQEREIAAMERTIMQLIQGRKNYDAGCPTQKENRELWLKTEMQQREIRRLQEIHANTQAAVARVIAENQRLKRITEHFGHKKTRK